MDDAALYRAEVTHARSGRIRHRLRHSVFYLYLDLDRLERTARRCRFFSCNRFNLVSFYDRDHGSRDGRPVREWINDQLDRAGLHDPRGRVFLLTLPRILGFVFNPLSVYYCFDRNERLIAVLYEVRNTFGELHGYLLPARPSLAGVVQQETDKRFHVSPFIGMKARYRFRLNIPGERLTLGIAETIADGGGLTACLVGRRRPFGDAQLLRALVAMPLMTLKVVAAIHLHAVRLWLRGARFYRKPPVPYELVTFGTSAAGELIQNDHVRVSPLKTPPLDD
jgi:DUF1365 family protein